MTNSIQFLELNFVCLGACFIHLANYVLYDLIAFLFLTSCMPTVLSLSWLVSFQDGSTSKKEKKPKTLLQSHLNYTIDTPKGEKKGRAFNHHF